MGQLVSNKFLNYWIVGFVFSIIFAIVTFAVGFLNVVPFLGWVIYIIVMPYIAGRLVDYFSDKWMD